MNSLEIKKAFKNYNCFIGVFPRDLLPKEKITKRPIALIVNTDPSYLPGQHWIALFINTDNVAEYFDSYGLPPLNKEIFQFLNKLNVEKLVYQTKQLQGLRSSTCGHYCVTFIKLRCQEIPFYKILFLNFNDQNIRKFI
jgi:hypothetical protein